MAAESLLGETVARSDIKDFMVVKGIYYAINGVYGSTFGQLGRVIKSNPALAAVGFYSTGPSDIANHLAGNPLCLVENTATFANGQYTFQIRDPANYNVEIGVLQTDLRIAGNHRVWLMSS